MAQNIGVDTLFHANLPPFRQYSYASIPAAAIGAPRLTLRANMP
jgi:hypothetical protein